MQLLEEFVEYQIDFALEMEAYETEHVEVEKEQNIAKEPEMMMQPPQPMTPLKPQPHKSLPKNEQEEQVVELYLTPTPNQQHDPQSKPT